MFQHTQYWHTVFEPEILFLLLHFFQMTSPKRLFLACAILLTISCVVMSEQNMPELFQRVTRKKYCGPQLPRILNLVCEGMYNSYQKRKPSADMDELVDFPADDSNELDLKMPSFPFKSRQDSFQMAPSVFRHKRGIVNECCAKGCSVRELMSYCAN
jgi:hypothetical protein